MTTAVFRRRVLPSQTISRYSGSPTNPSEGELMKTLFDVSGKIAVVSGGSSGIGFMMAQGLLENGAKVYITARKIGQLEEAAKALSEFGECIAIPSDLSTLAVQNTKIFSKRQ